MTRRDSYEPRRRGDTRYDCYSILRLNPYNHQRPALRLCVGEHARDTAE